MRGNPARAPKPKRPLPELRPRTVGDILDASVKVWGANIRKFAILAGILVLPFQFLGALVLKLMKPTVYDEVKRVQDLAGKGVKANMDITPRMMIGTLADFALGSLGTVLVVVAMAYVVGELYRSPSQSARSDQDPVTVIGAVLRRTHVAYAALFASVVISVLAGLAITVPLGVVGELAGLPIVSVSAGVFGAVALWVSLLVLRCAAPAIVIESTGVVATLKRSVFLARRQRRFIVVSTVVLVLVTGIPNALLTEMVRSLLTALGGNNGAFDFVWVGTAKTVATAFSAPLAAIGAVYIYLTLRIRAGETVSPWPTPVDA